MLLLPLGRVQQHTSGITNTQRGVFQQSCVIKLRIIKMQSWSIDLKKRNEIGDLEDKYSKVINRNCSSKDSKFSFE